MTDAKPLSDFVQRMRDLLAAIEQAENAVEKEIARQKMQQFLVEHGRKQR